jgi:hypothetical protein
MGRRNKKAESETPKELLTPTYNRSLDRQKTKDKLTLPNVRKKNTKTGGQPPLAPPSASSGVTSTTKTARISGAYQNKTESSSSANL